MNIVEQSTTKFQLGQGFQGPDKTILVWFAACLSRSDKRRRPERSAAVLEAKKGVGVPEVIFTFVSYPFVSTQGHGR